MAEDGDGAAAQEWRRNWPVVLAGTTGGSLATLHLYSTGVMIAPLEDAFGWTRALITSGLTISAVIAVILSPFIGLVIDRIGARRVALFGVIIFSIFVACLSQATPSKWLWWLIWSGIAIGGACIAPTVWAAGVASLFSKARGMALAVTLCGTAVGALIVPTVTNSLVDAFEWRGAYLALAAIWALVTLPLVYFGFSSSIDRNRLEDQGAVTAVEAPENAVSIRKAMASRPFIMLVLASVSIVIVASSLVANIVPILRSEGYSPGRAAAIAGLIGAGSISGRLCGGYLLDRIDGRLVAGLSVVVPIISCAILLWDPASVTAVSTGVFILGLAVGVEWDAVAYLASRYFGVQSFGVIFGTIGGLSLLFNGLGPVYASYVYDLTESYVPAIWSFIPLCLLSSAFFFALGPYRSALAEADT